MLFTCAMMLNLAFPLSPQLLLIKVGLILATALSAILHASVIGRSGLHRNTVILHIVTIGFSLIAGFVGVLNETPGAINQIMYYAMWPTLYFLMLMGLSGARSLKHVQTILYASSAFFGAYGVLYVLTQLHYIPITPIYSFLSQFSREGENVARHAGYIEIDFAPLSSAPFLVPFVLAMFMLNDYRKFTGWLLFALVLVVTLLSGRRALWLDVFLAPVIVLGVALAMGTFRRRVWSSRHLAGMLLTVVALFFGPPVLIDTLGLNSEALRDYLQTVTKETDLNSSGGIRRYQSQILLEDWAEKPIFGSGLGAVSRVIRNPDVPWSYESTFEALLFQGGLVTTIGYVLFILLLSSWVFVTALRHAAFRVFGLALLTGMICYLAASLSNPYLMRIDGLWVFLFPLAYCNVLSLMPAQENKLEKITQKSGARRPRYRVHFGNPRRVRYRLKFR